MILLRIATLTSVAMLTMGSGGVIRSSPGDGGSDSGGGGISYGSRAEAQSSDVSSTSSTSESTLPDIETVPPPPVTTETAAIPPKRGSALEVALSDDYIQGRYFTGGGLLGLDQANGSVGFYLSDGRDIIGDVGLMSDPVEILIDGLTLSAGARGYLALLSNPNDDVFGVGPGVEARYGLPFPHPMYVVGSVFYAPDILTLGDAQDIFDLDLRYEAQLIPNAVGFIGYREFRFNSDEGPDTEAASEFQVGARFAF